MSDQLYIRSALERMMVKRRVPIWRELMMFLLVWVTVSSADSACASAVVVYPAPGRAALNDTFSVAVRVLGGEWQKLDVYAVRVDVHTLSQASFAYFDFSGSVEVRVTHNKVHVEQAEIRPDSYDIVPRRSKELADSFTFTLNHPRNLSIEVNGDRLHNLHLFANPIESGVPSPADTNVIYFGPGFYGPDPVTHRRTIHVGSGKTVYLAGGSVVQGVIVTDVGATNVAIRGRGVLDTSLWNDPKGVHVAGQDWQTPSITLRRATNVLIEGIILKQHVDFAVLGGESDRVTIDNLKSFSSQEWGDGINMKASRHIKIRNCFLRTSDDCVAVYGSRGGYHGGASDWDVADSVLWADKAHAVMIGIHGAYQADGDLIENLHFHNLDVLEDCEYSTNFWGALSITCGDKNTVRNVDFDDIRVEHIREAGGYLIRLAFGCYQPSTTLGRMIENIHFRNVTYTGNAGVFISGMPEHPIKGIVIDNLVINGERITNAQGNITIGENVTGVSFN